MTDPRIDEIIKKVFGLEIGPDGVRMIGPNGPIDNKKKAPKISDLYGTKPEDYDLMVKEMLADMIRYDKKATIDKHFKELGAEGRCRIIAFCEALDLMHQANGVWGRQ